MLASAKLLAHLAAGLAEAGVAATIDRLVPVGGGSTGATYRAELIGGRQLFVKSNRDPAGDSVLAQEAAGLTALGAVGRLRVPELAALVPAGDGPALLVLEWIETGVGRRDAMKDLGGSLAAHHRASASPQFGFAQDNHLGRSPQPNPPTDDWVEFWREHRLGHQLRLAREQGGADRELQQLGERLQGRLERFIGAPDEPACLLHGDLWGGNVLVAATGGAVVIDPACYYGRREADLAMTRLFGGFDAGFDAGYQEVWPLAAGVEERYAVYELYHLLNHLNLFGGSYRPACIERLRRLVG